MPVSLVERKTVGPKKGEAEGLLRDVISDFVTRVKVAPMGTVAFTGLNLLSSLIPSASFIISDAILARIVQRIDPNFKLTYDQGSEHYGKSITEVVASNPESKGLILQQLRHMALQGNSEEQLKAQAIFRTVGQVAQRKKVPMHEPGKIRQILEREYKVNYAHVIQNLQRQKQMETHLKRLPSRRIPPAGMQPNIQEFLRQQLLKNQLKSRQAQRVSAAPRRPRLPG